MIVECKLKLPKHYSDGVYNGIKFVNREAVVREDQPRMAKLITYFKRCYSVEVEGEEAVSAQPEVVVDGPAPIQEDRPEPDIGDIPVPAEEDGDDSDEGADDEPSDDDSDYYND